MISHDEPVARTSLRGQLNPATTKLCVVCQSITGNGVFQV
jgi:hypothetical protein